MYSFYRSAHEMYHVLRRQYRLPVYLDGDHVLLRCGSDIAAVTMPPAVGRQVCKILTLSIHTVAPPAVEVPSADRWILLCATESQPVDAQQILELARHGVGVQRPGYCVVMPTSAWGPARWAEDPAPAIGARLPARSVVLDAAIAAVRSLPAPGKGRS
ncbi:hypothetical protein GCM10027088_05220 [Nocardia goodfellowii]|uniref:Uncharacterized protein n=1 Tax=Nocardia goodfellowii TaxID=882446 RepID=A0ABS4QG54_9NOCA|nr:hypothetical protein [Nocardia goodfellowii]